MRTGLWVSYKLTADDIDGAVGNQRVLDAETAENCSGLFANIGVKGRAGLGKMVTRSKNVVGLVRGQGPNADEFVVLGAHYDHLGTSKPHSWLGKLYESESRIHNGADDNASGTAGLIELGKALSRWPGLNRSVLLIAFTGEELGLHGSRQFVERPTVPLDKMVAMLNMDMIGRMSPGTDSLTIYGTRTAEQFGGLIDRCAGEVGLKVTTHPNGSGRSDAASFYKADIPAMHFFTGLHPDYHRPTDDAEKVNQADATRVVQMIYRMTRQLVDKEQRPTYRYIAGRARLSGQAKRAVMGIWPDQSDRGAGKGVLVGRTSPNGPAEKAGMQTGDRILRLDGQEVSDLDSVLNVTGKKKPGDVLEVVIDRQGKQIELQLTLAAG